MNKDGMSPDPAKVATVCDLKSLTDVKELRRIIGMVNFLCKFLPDLATMMKPLTELLRDDCVRARGPNQEASFAKIKTAITSSPVLAFYDPALTIRVAADASSY